MEETMDTADIVFARAEALRKANGQYSIQESISTFKVPDGYELESVPGRFKANRSIIYDYGVKAKVVVANPRDAYSVWFCLSTESCRDKSVHGHHIAIKGAATNCTTHLRDAHGIVGERTCKLLKRKPNDLEHLAVEMSKRPKEESADHIIWSIRYALMGLELSWPIHWAQNPSLRALFNRPQADLTHTSHTVRKCMSEIYASTIARLIVAFKTLREQATARFHLTVSHLTESSSGDRYVGLRLSFVDQSFSLKSALIGITTTSSLCPCRVDFVRYDAVSSFSEEDDHSDSVTKAWINHTLAEFGLNPSDIRSCTTDSLRFTHLLSDLARSSGVDWQCCWSVPELISSTLCHALGRKTTSDTSGSFPLYSEELLQIVKAVASLQLQSPGTFNLTMQEVDESVGCLQEMHKIPGTDPKTCPYIWASLIKLLREALLHWDWLVKAAAECSVTSFPLHDREKLSQFYSVLHPLGRLMITARDISVPTSIDVLLEIYDLKKTVLNVHSPLALVDPLDCTENDTSRTTEDRHDHVRELQESIRNHLNAHFFDAYSSRSRSYCLDLCAAMYPPMVGLKHISLLVDRQHEHQHEYQRTGQQESLSSAAIIASVWRIVEDVAVVIGENEVTATRAANTNTADTTRGGSKGSASTGSLESPGKIVTAVFERVAELFPDSDEDQLAPSEALVVDVRKEVRDELGMYRALRVKITDCQPGDLLDWWKKSSDRLPRLAAAARVLLAWSANGDLISTSLKGGGAGKAMHSHSYDSATFVEPLRGGCSARAMDEDPGVCNMVLMLKLNMALGALPSVEDIVARTLSAGKDQVGADCSTAAGSPTESQCKVVGNGIVEGSDGEPRGNIRSAVAGMSIPLREMCQDRSADGVGICSVRLGAGTGVLAGNGSNHLIADIPVSND